MAWFLFLIIFIILLIPTAYAAYIGAPYVPVRRPALKKAFDKLQIGSQDTVVDLGAGDGGVLVEVARRGARAVGYELSPIMWAIAWVRLSIFRAGKTPGVNGKTPGVEEARRRTPQIFLKNFYRQTLPPDTTIIYTFLMPQNLPRLVNYLATQKLPRAKYLLSYTFALPNTPPRDIIQTPAHGTIYVYHAPDLLHAFSQSATIGE